MNLTVAFFFEMMNIGVAHLLLLICFNTPSLTSLSNSTFRVHSFFGNRERSAMVWLSTFLKFNIVGFVIPCPLGSIE